MRRESEKLNSTIILDMNGNEFPFGVISDLSGELSNKKILVRKHLQFRTPKEEKNIREKLAILTKLCHRNVINIRGV